MCFFNLIYSLKIDTYNPKETISVIRSPKTWVWKTTEQDIFKGMYKFQLMTKM